ncbi:MAG: hypothetical protein KGL42_00460 [Betaproteobacteria bacterium]|nr:hypothetical protein [Betaproteobacteria bacterium]
MRLPAATKTVKRSKRLRRSPVFRAAIKVMELDELCMHAEHDFSHYSGTWEIGGGSAWGIPPIDLAKASECQRRWRRMQFLACLWNALKKKLETRVGSWAHDEFVILEFEGQGYPFPRHWCEVEEGFETLKLEGPGAHVLAALLHFLACLVKIHHANQNARARHCHVRARPLPTYCLTPKLLAQRPQAARHARAGIIVN